MRKKRKIESHLVQPDKKFASVTVARLINKVMKNGEKRKAVKIVYQAAQIVEKNTSSPFLTILEGALENIKPSLETKSRKFGASNRRFPVKVEEKRALTLALR